MTEKEQVLAQAKNLALLKRDLDEAYEEVIVQAHRAGVSNIALARALGKTEAAVRMYKKRHNLGQPTTEESYYA